MTLRVPLILAVLLSAAFAASAVAHPTSGGAYAGLGMFSERGGSVFAGLEAPLEGVGQNMRIVANVPLDPGAVPGGGNDRDFDVNASDLELAGDYAYVGSYTQGMVIVDISTCADPAKAELCKPTIAGVYPCSGGQFDIQLSPDAKIAVVGHESASANKACHPGEEGAAIIDISDKRNPREVAFISDRKDGQASGQVVDGAHNVTLDFPNLYIDQYTTSYAKGEIFSLAPQPAAPDAGPANPVKIGEVTFPAGSRQSGFHDSIPDHRPDGKNLLYGASISKTDVVDISDPSKPKVLQTFSDPAVSISHGAEPNHKRDVLIVSDEYAGGGGRPNCGGRGDAQVPLPAGQDPTSLGAVHFYRLDANGLVPGNGTDKVGIFNINYQANDASQLQAQAGCTSHVFWQAPDQNRMVIAWYGRGTRIVDFTDPAKPKEIGHFIPRGGDTWSAKPHRGFIFAGDILRGLDVLVYTGEGGQAWPATSGPADVQRRETQRGGPGTGKPGDAPSLPGPGCEPVAGAPQSPTECTSIGGGAGSAGGGQGGSQGAPQSQAAAGRRFLISRRALRVDRRGRVAVRVSCRSSEPCAHGLVLRDSRGRTLARRAFRVAPRRRAVLRVRLSQAGRALVARLGTTRVTARAGTTEVSFRLVRARR